MLADRKSIPKVPLPCVTIQMGSLGHPNGLRVGLPISQTSRADNEGKHDPKKN